jgi:membrane protease subunit HflK
MNSRELSDLPAKEASSSEAQYRAVLAVFLGAALLGAAGAVAGGFRFGNPVLLDVAITLGLSAGILSGVLVTQILRTRSSKAVPEVSTAAPVMVPEPLPELVLVAEAPAPEPRLATAPGPSEETEVSAPKEELKAEGKSAIVHPTDFPLRFWNWFRGLGAAGMMRVSLATAGMFAIGATWRTTLPAILPTPLEAAIAAGVCLIAAGLAATAVHYLADIEPTRLHEAPELCRGARVVAWILVLAAASMGVEWLWQLTILRTLHFVVLAINLAVCYGLFSIKRPEAGVPGTFPIDLDVLSVLGSRTNVLAGILDAGQRQLGIDLRSTWALTVVRHSLEPLVIGLALIGWLSTSFTVVGMQEQGLVERLGVAVEGQPLQPGIHLHWPWPVDQVFRIPVQRVQALQIGHEGEEAEGPENVLWAVEHAPNEFTLVLGNGRDLITVDAAVQYLIVDPRAWRYHSQNPADALRAIAYRTVMRNTVNRTLSDALSENVVTLTGTMRDMVQQEADALGLGVKVLGFTVGGMHPPVPVASDYEAVVSAELGKVTAVVNAQVYHNQTVPAAQASVVVGENNARAEGAQNLGRAAGEAWSFRTLESQYRSEPEDYLFRRRLETLENGLAGRGFTVVDSRFQRDGGELWVIP